jgi:hypothetical protein
MNAYAPTGSTVDMSSINTPIAPALATSTVADEPATTTTVAAASTPAQPDTTVPTQPPASASTTTSSITDIMKSLFTQTNMYIVLGFFAGYFVLYTVLGKFFNQGQEPSVFNLAISRTIDILFFIVFGSVVYILYNKYKADPNTNFFADLTKQFTDYVSSPTSSITTGLFLIIFYFIVYLFRIPNEPATKPFVVSSIENIAWILLVISLFVDFFTYSLGVSFYDLFPFLNFSKKQAATVVPSEKEVFNVSNNIYTYDEAQAVCKVFGADLANYSQIEEAYNKGAEWCNYGWSEGQMALFPTQIETWNELQKEDTECPANSKTPSVKNNCGRPGINGGYMANPYLRFGVNCYGKKPVSTVVEQSRTATKPEKVHPKSEQDILLEKKVEYWKQHKDKMLNLNAFNNVKWSSRESGTTANAAKA